MNGASVSRRIRSGCSEDVDIRRITSDVFSLLE